MTPWAGSSGIADWALIVEQKLAGTKTAWRKELVAGMPGPVLRHTDPGWLAVAGIVKPDWTSMREKTVVEPIVKGLGRVYLLAMLGFGNFEAYPLKVTGKLEHEDLQRSWDVLGRQHVPHLRNDADVACSRM
jgi:hypothetical protein